MFSICDRRFQDHLADVSLVTGSAVQTMLCTVINVKVCKFWNSCVRRLGVMPLPVVGQPTSYLRLGPRIRSSHARTLGFSQNYPLVHTTQCHDLARNCFVLSYHYLHLVYQWWIEGGIILCAGISLLYYVNTRSTFFVQDYASCFSQ